MKTSISFLLNDTATTIHFPDSNISPTTTVLEYLRTVIGLKGTKEGCAEGDCGACTVVLASLNGTKLKYEAVNSCLLFVPHLHEKQLITVEHLSHNNQLHPIQEAIIEAHGSQCGFCTPGMVMSLFAMFKNKQQVDRVDIVTALNGNLCRCTGYRPIIDAALSIAKPPADYFNENEPRTVEMLLDIKKQKDELVLKYKKQTYFMPLLIDSAVQIKKNHPDINTICGATDQALLQTKKHQYFNKILDLSFIKGFNIVKNKVHFLEIGAGTSIENLKNSLGKQFDALESMCNLFGAGQIRNIASVGGNIANASPVSDLIPVFMAYRACINFFSETMAQTILLEDFIIGYKQTALPQDAIIVSIILPFPSNKEIIKSYKISKRKHLDISTVNACFRLIKDENKVIKDIALYYGGMAATVQRAVEAEQFLINKKWNEQNVGIAANLIEKSFEPLSDARSTAEARQFMAANLFLDFFDTNKNNTSIAL